MPEKNYDVVIIGAGPAGSSAALYFKKYDSSLRVALVDRRTFPRDKVCGDGIPLKTFNLLSELGFSDDMFFETGFKVNSMIVYSPLGKPAVFGDIKDNASAKSGCIPRENFDYIIYKKAADSVDGVYTGHRMKSIRDTDSGKSIDLVSPKNEQINLAAKLIIGADGVNSAVAREYNLIPLAPEHRFEGLRTYYEGPKFDPAVHIIYDIRLLPGYIWLFPVSSNRANVGFMVEHGFHKTYGMSLKEAFQDIIQTNNIIKELLKNAHPVSPLKGATLKLGAQPGTRIGDGVMLIGDSAGFINPLTGGGIYSAILSAKNAAQVGVSALHKNDTSCANLQAYDRWWKYTILPGFLFGNKMKNYVKYSFFNKWFFDRITRGGPISRFFISTYGKPLPKTFYLNPWFWKNIFFAGLLN